MIALDITTTYRNRWRIPHGIARVEQEIIRRLIDEKKLDICFFRHAKETNVAKLIDREAVSALIAESKDNASDQSPITRNEAAGPFMKRLRLLEWTLRQSRRKASKLLFAKRTGLPNPVKTGDSWILFTGHNWHAHELARKLPTTSRIAFLIHDILPLTHSQFADPEFAAYFSFVANRADRIFTVSEYSKSAILSVAPRLAGRVSVVHLGMDHLFNRTATMPRPTNLGVPDNGQFLLTVGGQTERKNQRFLIDVMRRATSQGVRLPKLLIVGSGFINSHTRVLQDQIDAQPSIRQYVKILDRVDDDQLQWLYQNCAAFLFSSLAEGWGMPVTEAVGFGRRVVVSNTTSVPEATLGFGEILPLEPDLWVRTIADAVAQGANADAARQQSAVAAYTWKRCVDFMLDDLEIKRR